MAELLNVKRTSVGGDGGRDSQTTGMVNRGFSNFMDTDKAFVDDKNPQKAQDALQGEQVARKGETKSKKMQSAILSGLQYKVDDNPPWISTILLGFQHYLMLLSSNLATPGLMASIICAVNIPEAMHVRSVLLGNMIFACGVCTLLQTFLGARLPIVQCPAFAYIVPMLALVKIPRWSCPAAAEEGLVNITANGSQLADGAVSSDHVERMNQLTGSIMVAALLEILIGASGLVSVLLKFIGPLTVAPTIMLMGLSVAETGFDLSGKHWGISAATIILIILFSEIIPIFEFSNPFSKNKDQKIQFVLHKLFSVILSTCIMWFVCYILTATGALPEEGHYGYEARTDIRLDVINEVAWVRFPYPGYWGTPTFNSGFFIAMIAGVVTSVIESIGDYYTCARLAGALPPPTHAVNRGIFVEGIDCIISSAVGAGFGVTSCSQNIGVISLTKVGSRRVVLMGGFIMALFGCLGKFSAVVVSMPDPIIGASFLVLFGVLAAVGASNLQYVDLNSSRNLVVFGISLFLGLSFPNWVTANEQLIRTGNENLDQVIQALLANNMFMGCFSALVLDNVIPGTDEERGIIIWREVPEDTDEDSDDNQDNNLTMKTYDLPFGMNLIRSLRWGKYVPFFPTFEGFNDLRCCPCKKDQPDLDEVDVVVKNNP
ncbi:solute carrier family 23 member 1-like [Mya arenaria]|uniref:solute carrier family 23 member 1-like n=1 Tax=Mya arenaria TaxID=6604 RepID=UPI0022E48758|nr:solute carrier family 23 member 1-like [Mya arenaria]XP_052797379.1 solute carrier family 23 member 1-like [Mya arenaria]XP_052797380.1 solute carrier family 23 member 1-like [Mya arenaria]XP_052797381.1 solute carrier family 23 member 1-like [Mya arenaria]XP_052797382.1 solute carrier family 23 member 1-like [Mya arenaria]